MQCHMSRAECLSSSDVDLVVLDWIGFSQETRALFREITNKPVLLPMTLIGRIAREIVAVSTIKGSIGVAIQIPK